MPRELHDVCAPCSQDSLVQLAWVSTTPEAVRLTDAARCRWMWRAVTHSSAVEGHAAVTPPSSCMHPHTRTYVGSSGAVRSFQIQLRARIRCHATRSPTHIRSWRPWPCRDHTFACARLRSCTAHPTPRGLALSASSPPPVAGHAPKHSVKSVKFLHATPSRGSLRRNRRTFRVRGPTVYVATWL
jgi:hypothetical protein